MAVERVEALLRAVAGALDTAGVPYAIVGGNAVAAWVASVDPDAVRTTKDVDVLLRRPDLGRVASLLTPQGLVAVEVLGVHMFVDRDRPSPRSGVHVVVANERIRPHYTQPAPDPAVSVRLDGLSVINLDALLAMKLQSYRDIDRAHVRDLMAVGLVDAGMKNRLPLELSERLQQILETE